MDFIIEHNKADERESTRQEASCSIYVKSYRIMRKLKSNDSL